jgi:hypothetical protein
MVWSAGQREFVPLLLGLYWLLPAGSISRRDAIDWVVIEEPEMGLHSRAIEAILMIVLALIKRGYKVCLSTHSPQVLDLVWALRTLQQTRGGEDDLISLMGVKKNDAMREIATRALRSVLNVYHFTSSGEVKDISGLDPGAESENEASWGELTSFSGRAAEVVARAMAREPSQP